VRRGLALALLPWLVACSGLRSSAPPLQSYVLRAAPPAQRLARAAAPRVTLRVLYPTTAPGLDSEHIMLLRSDRRLSYYAASRWAARVPTVVEQLAVDTLRNTGAWAAVEDSRGTWSADYFLQLDIRRFEADDTEAGAPPLVHVTLDCTVGRRARDEEVIASFVAERAVSASENRLGAVVAAFEQAVGGALADAAVQASAAIDEKGVQAQAARKPAP